MKKLLLSILLLSGVSFAGSISSPTVIENGKSYSYTSTYSNEYYTFTLSSSGTVLFGGNAVYSDGRSTNLQINFFNSEYSPYKPSDCTTEYIHTSSSKTCTFEKGTYVIQASVLSGNFSVFSTKMTDYVAPGCSTSTTTSSNIYTQAQMDTKLAEKEQSTKDTCKLNPSSCGIETTTTQVATTSTTPLTESHIGALSTGWHLMGTSASISGFGIFKSANTVWFYTNNEWQNYNPNSITPPSVTPTDYQGFWVKK